MDWVFCASGMTVRQAGSREAFRRVDYEYPLIIAKAALERGASHFLLVSAVGANARSAIFYFRIKGKLEELVQALGYRPVTIPRPSILMGHRQHWRVGEAMGKRMAWLMRRAGARYTPLTKEPVSINIELDPSRVQLDFTVEQAELLRECLFTQAEQDGGQRNRILSLHEQVLGVLSETKQRRTDGVPV